MDCDVVSVDDGDADTDSVPEVVVDNVMEPVGAAVPDQVGVTDADTLCEVVPERDDEPDTVTETLTVSLYDGDAVVDVDVVPDVDTVSVTVTDGEPDRDDD